MKRSCICLVAGVVAGLLSASGAQAFAPPATVSVRVEGANGTLTLPRTTVTTTTTPVVKDGHAADACPGTTDLGALEQATGGDWTGQWFAGFSAYTVDTIKGQTHTFATDGDFWSFYVNGDEQNNGACDTPATGGDDVLFYDACGGAPGDGCYAGEPLIVTAPATVTPGAAFTVHVAQVTSTQDPTTFMFSSTSAPSAGATVSGGAAPATTGADGNATVTLAASGPAALRATKGDRVPDEAGVCATTGSDGACGTTVPATPTTPTAPTVPLGAQSAPDTTPPVAAIVSIADGRVYARGHGPRTLAGTADDPGSGIDHVALRLIRRLRGHCSTFLPSRAAFAGIHCGAADGVWFRVGSGASWSYLLPAILPSGHYTLDVRATDHAHNRTTALVAGREHVAFTVR